MATQKLCDAQSTSEIRTYYLDFTDDLPTGVTVSSATSTHTPPSGAAVTPTLSVSSPDVAVTVPALTVVGIHQVLVHATLSDSEVSDILLIIPVRY